jgi:hypothetical protein
MAATARATMKDAVTETALRDTLAASIPDLHRCCWDPWMVIGSAAAWLLGAPVAVADLDVLTSVRDADNLAGHWRERLETTHAEADDDRFRSRFARFGFPGLALEVMGGLEVADGDRWQPVSIAETVVVEIAGLDVPVPVLAEQIRLLQSFGRPKDLRRVSLLRALDGSGT